MSHSVDAPRFASDVPEWMGKSLENSAAHWALACGAISIAPALSMTLLPAAIFPAIVAMVLGVMGFRAAEERFGLGRVPAIAGIAMACVPIGMAVVVVMSVLVLALLGR